MNAEKYLMKMSMHFGFVKETVGKGTVIEVDRVGKRVILSDGRIFNDLRDIDICIKKAFVVVCTEENVQSVAKTEDLSAYKKMEPKKKEAMKIIKSDADDMQDQIDISWTKNKKQDTVKKGSLEVIREKTTEQIRGIPVVRASEAEQIENMHVGKDIEVVVSAKVPAPVAPVETTAKRMGRPFGSKNKPKVLSPAAQAKLDSRKAEIESNRLKATAEVKE